MFMSIMAAILLAEIIAVFAGLAILNDPDRQ